MIFSAYQCTHSPPFQHHWYLVLPVFTYSYKLLMPNMEKIEGKVCAPLPLRITAALLCMILFVLRLAYFSQK